MLKAKSPFKKKSDILPPLLTTTSSTEDNRKPSNTNTNAKGLKQVTFPPSIQTTITNPITTTVNLDDWEVKHIQSPSNKKQTQLIAQAEEMVSDAAVYQINKKKHLTNQFIKVKTMKSSNELRNYIKEIEDDNAKALKQIEIEKMKFNFDVFQYESNPTATAITALRPKETMKSQIPIPAPRKKVFSYINFDQMRDNKEERKGQSTLSPLPLPTGALENVINSEVLYNKKNKHKAEQCFNDELLNIMNKVHTQETELTNLCSKMDNLIHEADEKKIKASNANDILTILTNERLSKLKTSKRNSVSFANNLQSLDIITSAQKDIDKLRLDYNNQLILNKRVLPLLQLKIKGFKSNIKSLKCMKQRLIKESINYYMRLLKAGIDVRGVGLAWIIAKLYELGKHVIQSDFPNWINQHYYDYLIEYAKKRIEISKLNILVSLIKKQFIKKGHPHDGNSNGNNLTTKRGTTLSNDDDDDDSSNMTHNGITGHKRGMSLETLLDAYKQFTSNRHDNDYGNIINDNETNEEIKKKLQIIKQSLNTNAINNDDNIDNKEIANTISQMNHTFLLTQRRVFDQIIGEDNDKKGNIRSTLLFLNDLIAKKEKEMLQYKSNEVYKFKHKFSKDKTKGTEECFNYDIIFSALFGNCIHI